MLLGYCDYVNLFDLNTNTVKTENGSVCIKEVRLQVVVRRAEDMLMSHEHNTEEYCTIKLNSLKKLRS
jgi:hypothetical protein